MSSRSMKDGAALFKGLRARLGSDLDPIYETYETPYTVYSVFKGADEDRHRARGQRARQRRRDPGLPVNGPGDRRDQEFLFPTPGEPRGAAATRARSFARSSPV